MMKVVSSSNCVGWCTISINQLIIGRLLENSRWCFLKDRDNVNSRIHIDLFWWFVGGTSYFTYATHAILATSILAWILVFVTCEYFPHWCAMPFDGGWRLWQLKNPHELNVVVHMRNLLFQIGHPFQSCNMFISLNPVICNLQILPTLMSFYQIIARWKDCDAFSTWQRLEFSNMYRVLGWYLWWDWCVRLWTIWILGRLLENLKYLLIEDGDNVNLESTVVVLCGLYEESERVSYNCPETPWTTLLTILWCERSCTSCCNVELYPKGSSYSSSYCQTALITGHDLFSRT